jgi:hypothetical protein
MAGESLTRSLSFYCVKSYQRLCPDCGNSIAKLIFACHSGRCGTPNRMTLLATRSFSSRSHDAVIRVCDQSGNVIETHEHKGDFKEW